MNYHKPLNFIFLVFELVFIKIMFVHINIFLHMLKLCFMYNSLLIFVNIYYMLFENSTFIDEIFIYLKVMY
jgi:hypothetical protein